MANLYKDDAMVRQQELLAMTGDMVSQRRELLTSLALKSGDHVLDIGSGNGILCREIREAVGERGRVCGIDASEGMVMMARKLCPAAEFVEGDATRLPFDADSFDAVTVSQLLCFLANPDSAIAEMFRVLKPGGKAVLLDTDWSSLVWNCRDMALMERTFAMYTAPYADAHIPRTLSRRLVAAGFEIAERRCFTILNWEPDPESYSQQTAGFVRMMMDASDDFTDSDWKNWSADQHETAEAGEFMFSLNRYVFGAVKPAN